jgi:hypothetical protein
MPVQPHDKKTLREMQVEARAKRVADLIPRVVRVRVVPKNDAIRKGIIHPDGAIGFPPTGAVEWPLDGFTQRRLRDGDVYLESAQAEFLDEQTGVMQSVNSRAQVYTPQGPVPITTHGEHQETSQQRRASAQRAADEHAAAQRAAAERAAAGQQPRHRPPERPRSE